MKALDFGSKERRAPRENLVPLINVIFLLLIFFLVGGTLRRAELFEVAPPLSTSEGEAPREPVLILLGRDGRLGVDDVEITLERLPDAIATKGLDEGSARVELRADAGARAGDLHDVLEVLRDAGVEGLRLTTELED